MARHSCAGQQPDAGLLHRGRHPRHDHVLLHASAATARAPPGLASACSCRGCRPTVCGHCDAQGAAVIERNVNYSLRSWLSDLVRCRGKDRWQRCRSPGVPRRGRSKWSNPRRPCRSTSTSSVCRVDSFLVQTRYFGAELLSRAIWA